MLLQACKSYRQNICIYMQMFVRLLQLVTIVSPGTLCCCESARS